MEMKVIQRRTKEYWVEQRNNYFDALLLLKELTKDEYKKIKCTSKCKSILLVNFNEIEFCVSFQSNYLRLRCPECGYIILENLNSISHLGILASILYDFKKTLWGTPIMNLDKMCEGDVGLPYLSRIIKYYPKVILRQLKEDSRALRKIILEGNVIPEDDEKVNLMRYYGCTKGCLNCENECGKKSIYNN